MRKQRCLVGVFGVLLVQAQRSAPAHLSRTHDLQGVKTRTLYVTSAHALSWAQVQKP